MVSFNDAVIANGRIDDSKADDQHVFKVCHRFAFVMIADFHVDFEIISRKLRNVFAKLIKVFQWWSSLRLRRLVLSSINSPL